MLPKALLALSLCLVCRVTCEPNIIFKLRKMECQVNQNRVANTTCVVKAVNWNKAVAQMDCDLIKPIRNLTGRLRMFKQDYSNRFQPFLIDVKFNVCDILGKKKFHIYGNIVRKVTGKYSTLNHSCPIDGHQMARDLDIDASLLPEFPLGIYQASLLLNEHLGNNPIFIADLRFFFNAMEAVALKKKKKV